MRLWAVLYAVIWLLLLEFLLGTWPNPPWIVPYFHAVIGLLLILVLYRSYVFLRATRVPARVKRIASASFSIALLMAVLGLLLWFNVGASWIVPGVNVSVYDGILVFHLLNAIALLTQCAAVAIAYDMWEDHEFEKETEPGVVPAAGRPGVDPLSIRP